MAGRPGKGPLVAAITLDPRGGGVAQVSRLVWEVVRRRWDASASLLTLLPDDHVRDSIGVKETVRLKFGARLAAAQLSKPPRWIFFTHLAVARAQAFVPDLLHRPYAVFIHGIEVWHPLSHSQRRVLRHATLRITNSRFTADQFSRRHGDLGETVVCPLALQPGVAFDSDLKPGNDAAHRVIIVGRMDAAERYKGHDQALDAWPGVLALIPDAQLTIVGDGTDAPRLKRKASALGLDASVTFTGFLSPSDLDDAYARASVLVMPSRCEGFGLVYLEAMAHGLPCIGSIHDAASELIVDGVTGFLVDQADIGALTSRIVRLLTNSSERRSMAIRGIQRLQEAFTFESFARRLEVLVDEGLEPKATEGRIRRLSGTLVGD